MTETKGYLYAGGGFVGEIEGYDCGKKTGRISIYGLENLAGHGKVPCGWSLVSEDDFVINDLWRQMVRDVRFSNWQEKERHGLWNNYVSDHYSGESFDMYCRRIYNVLEEQMEHI